MGVYDDDIAGALQDIAEFGRSVTWRQFVANPADDPAAPGPGTIVDYTGVSIAFFPNEKLSLHTTGTAMPLYLDVAEGVFYGIMGSQPFMPSLHDLVIDGERTYRLRPIDGIDTLAPNGQVVLHTLRFVE